MWAICAVCAIAYTSNLQKHEAFLKYDDDDELEFNDASTLLGH